MGLPRSEVVWAREIRIPRGDESLIRFSSMAREQILHKARLIPVSGITSDQEAEERATSALLAVLTIVRDLSIELLSPLGASRAQKATVEAFSEVAMVPGGQEGST